MHGILVTLTSVSPLVSQSKSFSNHVCARRSCQGNLIMGVIIILIRQAVPEPP